MDYRGQGGHKGEMPPPSRPAGDEVRNAAQIAKQSARSATWPSTAWKRRRALFTPCLFNSVFLQGAWAKRGGGFGSRPRLRERTALVDGGPMALLDAILGSAPRPGRVSNVAHRGRSTILRRR